jgi:hypothetical protein
LFATGQKVHASKIRNGKKYIREIEHGERKIFLSFQKNYEIIGSK